MMIQGIMVEMECDNGHHFYAYAPSAQRLAMQAFLICPECETTFLNPRFEDLSQILHPFID